MPTYVDQSFVDKYGGYDQLTNVSNLFSIFKKKIEN